MSGIRGYWVSADRQLKGQILSWLNSRAGTEQGAGQGRDWGRERGRAEPGHKEQGEAQSRSGGGAWTEVGPGRGSIIAGGGA